MHLSDVVELSEFKVQEDVKLAELKSSREDFLTVTKAQDILSRLKGGWNRNSTIHKDDVNELVGRYNRARLDAFWKKGTLPEVDLKLDLEDEVVELLPFVSAPTARLKELRRIADVLGMALIPFSYVPYEAYKNEEPTIQRMVARFSNYADDAGDTYLLAPIQYYSPKQHLDSFIKTDRNLPVWGGRDVSQAILAVTMTIPMFRSMRAELDDMREQLSNYRQRLDRVEKDVSSLSEQVKALQKSVQEAKLEQVRETEAFRAWSSEGSTLSYSYDPLMFVVPRGVSLTDDISVFVGPFWGKDFQDIVLTALGLRMIEGQRKALWDDLYKRWHRY